MVQKCATCIKYPPGILTGHFHIGLSDNHTCSQFLRMQMELFCENAQLTCYYPFHNSTLKCILQQSCLLLVSSPQKPSKLLTISPMSLWTTRIKKALTARLTAKHSQIYCLITSKCLQQEDCGPFPQLVLWELTFSDSLWIWSTSMEPFTLRPDLGGPCQFSWVAVFHLILPVSRCLAFPQEN